MDYVHTEMFLFKNMIGWQCFLAVDESLSPDQNEDMIENSDGKEMVMSEGSSDMEPCVGMEFESEEAAKVFYDAYATHLGFIMRVDAFRRSMRDGKVVWRRLVCNKEGFRKLRPRRSENRKPRAVTREGCKAMIVVKKEKTGKWVVTRFVKDHNHSLVAIPANGRRSVILSQTPDEKDVKIRELTAELQRERKRSAAYQDQLEMVLKDMEDHSHHFHEFSQADTFLLPKTLLTVFLDSNQGLQTQSMDVSSWDGALSSSDFSLAARTFAEKWKRLDHTFPPWSWIACTKEPWVASHEVEGYLSLENICLLGLTEEDNDEGSRDGEEETSCSKEEEPIDTATLVQSFGREVHFYDFHIVYSASYRVPVFYFRAYCSGGQPLALDEIEKDLPTCSAKVLLASKWTFITLEEHPYLNRPWYKLHPCGTSEWMKLLFLGDSALAKHGVAMGQYLVSWFSVVGQVVGLRIPFEMLNDSN
ncbi:hypothetical protein QYF36_003904 [Acer negundo]|nr:hypothetical protein QYF36_003904 [Acer negundo]